MKDSVVAIRNKTIHFLYVNVLKKIYFRLDPEDVHDNMTRGGKLLGTTALTRGITHMMFGYKNPVLTQNVCGITFENPIGLAAGFDKNAELTQILPDVGFGFEEVGSITGEACPGNPKPRLWRLKGSQSLMVYYGLKNDGSEKLSQKLASMKFRYPVGISIAKTNCEETCDTDAGIRDYVKAYKAFSNIGAYYTINISCPNAFGGQPFTDKERLGKLFAAINEVPRSKPIFIKMSPDLSLKEVDDILELMREYKMQGLIISNLTKNRNNPKIHDKEVPTNGGMSGKVVEDLSNAMIKNVYAKTKNEFVIVGCGGVFTAQDAYTKIKLGASLIQLITGMIFEGPQAISEINRGLVQLLKQDGFSNIHEAIGTGNNS